MCLRPAEIGAETATAIVMVCESRVERGNQREEGLAALILIQLLVPGTDKLNIIINKIDFTTNRKTDSMLSSGSAPLEPLCEIGINRNGV